MAANKLLSEGIAASSYTVFVDTANRRVNVTTDTYRGGQITVGLHTSSNVVVSNNPSDNIVLYATGTVKMNTAFFNDGTSMTTAGGKGQGSSTQFLAVVSFSNASPVCISGSTWTATMQNTQIMHCSLTGNWNAPNGTSPTGAVLFDGACATQSQGGCNITVFTPNASSANQQNPFSISGSKNVGAGSHSCCIALWVQGGGTGQTSGHGSAYEAVEY